MNDIYFSWQRLWAVIYKEFIQMKRDKLTFAMMIGIPMMQLILFGYAINNDPKHLPTAVVAADHSVFTRTFLTGMENTGYFKIVREAKNEAEANQLLTRGEVQFVVNIPQNFSQQLVRGEHPNLLLEADATDPAATSNAMSSVQTLTETVFNNDLTGNLAALQATAPPVNLVPQARYNPERITQYNIVPGLLSVVLTMTMVVITSMAITRERERGTMECLLATPIRPLEVMLGKITPYIVVGYIQVLLIVTAAHFLFHVPMHGSLLLLLVACLPFIAANLAVGLTFSTLVQTQLQGMQLSFFFFLPSLLLSGFMFPFRGMPQWAQYLGEILPLTHFLVIVRGILLKGNGFVEIAPAIGAILLFFLVMLFISLKKYRQTLD